MQALPDGDLRLNVEFSGGPSLGRCYAIFHNQVQLGKLEISPGYPYSAETPNVFTEIELESVRLLSFENITDFLGAIAMHVCNSKQKSDENSDLHQAIADAVMKALWQTQQITEYANLDGQDWGDLELHLRGVAPRWYFNRREALLKEANRGQPMKSSSELPSGP